MIETKTCRECSNKIHAKGLCVLHYNRWRRSDPDYEGYIKGNIAVISSLANRIKTNATLEQIHSVYIWMVLQTLPLGNYDRVAEGI